MIVVDTATGPTDDVRALVGELERSLANQYDAEQRHGLPVDALFEPHIAFFVARLDGIAVGCGGVAFFETYGEVKRMYVRASARGCGVAQALLARIETTLRERGLEMLRLETGVRQAAAIRFYERAGFRERDAFGAYADMAATAIETSRFYEKRLG